MTTDELYERIDGKLTAMSDKLDRYSAKIEHHDADITAHGREAAEIKTRITKVEDEQSKINKLLWWALGGGTAAGAGLTKLLAM